MMQAEQIIAHLHAKSLRPTSDWLAEFVSSQKHSIPLNALRQTALFRLLASDITTSLEQTQQTTFPSDVLDANIAQRVLQGPIAVQVLDVQDVGTSKGSQIEHIESVERGETTKGREIIRVVPSEPAGPDAQKTASSRGPHKLLLQDARGMRMFAFELRPVEGIDTSMSIGCKLVLQNVVVARGVVLLDSATSHLLGGKIDSLHKKWKDGLKQSLKEAVANQQNH